MKPSNLYLRSIAANLTALRAIFATIRKDVDHGLKAAGEGNQNGAVGSIIPVEEQLRQAAILLQAILVLHRQN
jgi:hypothetical protein